MSSAATRLLVPALALILAACSGGSGSDKYHQTWTKPYAETSCADWRDAMDQHQQFVMAADILFTEQKTLKPDVVLPDDVMVGQFQGQIQGLCLTHASDDVTTAAFVVWTTGQDAFAPK
jgi:hypothetical protein